MEREQATLPFVVPSHLSKLFGLKASVIVEGEGAGGRDESERRRERGRGGGGGRLRQGLIAPVGVMVRQLSQGGDKRGEERKQNTGTHYFFSSSPLPRLFVAANHQSVLVLLLPSSPLVTSLKAGAAGGRVDSANWLSGSEEGGKTYEIIK